MIPQALPYVAKITKTEWDFLADHIIAHLVSLDHQSGAMQSGDDSRLQNAWEEVCHQVQVEESLLWEVYLDEIERVARHHIIRLPQAVQHLLWLDTDAYADWDEESSSFPQVCDTESILRHLVREVVIPIAGSYDLREIKYGEVDTGIVEPDSNESRGSEEETESLLNDLQEDVASIFECMAWGCYGDAKEEYWALQKRMEQLRPEDSPMAQVVRTCFQRFQDSFAGEEGDWHVAFSHATAKLRQSLFDLRRERNGETIRHRWTR